ncbi:MAG: hypothetical protein Q8K86_07250 [Candidatus Nanopelagicaceae bacterium]|nr:hypothetical protein [Candidatus Nanopelagicaceae bacterium]
MKNRILGPIKFLIDGQWVGRDGCPVCNGTGRVFAVHDMEMKQSPCKRCKRLFNTLNKICALGLFNELEELCRDGERLDRLSEKLPNKRLTRMAINVLLEHGGWSAVKIGKVTWIYGKGNEATEIFEV